MPIFTYCTCVFYTLFALGNQSRWNEKSGYNTDAFSDTEIKIPLYQIRYWHEKYGHWLMWERIQKNHNLVAKFNKLLSEINSLYLKTTKKSKDIPSKKKRKKEIQRHLVSSVFSVIKVVDLLCMFSHHLLKAV